MTRYFTWSDFDKSVDYIANQCKFMNLSGIYGVPRGGLCLAVALSHKLDIQLIEKPSKNSLIVDDVFETGTTLRNFKHIEGANFFVLVSKQKPIWWNAVNLTHKKEWIVFPWENKRNELQEEKEYKKKRGLN
ncbi:putative purine phosphoribosyltransferase-related protein [Prochlorococcus marinus str. MIT 9515]|uniref:Putative purine phosphoribosyltransferase-related protein n=1 Tax=Prochlorococcus marinus (strain MIT 9515) TaxID=167542 RepID=A2BWW0_PROM5|nr:phosphoribosyltransferase [Prochlorococcus marinus]ABM72271.1 putative purine phosphoribosyltransferase-related protein [Prochlorococcus marinus str. MIT 9515]